METQVRSGDWRITTLGTAILQSRFRTLQRPATPFELMDDAISYYRENFKPLFRISLWVYLIPIIFSILLLGPTIYLESLGTTGQLGALAVEYLGLFMLLPYLAVAPVVQVAFTTLAFRKIAAGEPITLRGLWESLKPRFLHLIANQLLAFMALGAILTIISLGFIALAVAVVLGVMMVAAGSPTLAIILMATLLLIITIVALVLAAYATVWFLPLPQIIVLEPNADAISAFTRAYELIRPNLKHAVLSCLAFWGVQAVFMLSVMILSLIALGIVVSIIAIYADLEQALNRWTLSLNQVYESVSYIAYMLVMPAMYMTSVLLYFDLRYRREGLDIYEVLRQSKE